MTTASSNLSSRWLETTQVRLRVLTRLVKEMILAPTSSSEQYQEECSLLFQERQEYIQMIGGHTRPNGARTISYTKILTNIHVSLKITTHACTL